MSRTSVEKRREAMAGGRRTGHAGMRKVAAGEAPQGGLWVGVGEGEGDEMGFAMMRKIFVTTRELYQTVSNTSTGQALQLFNDSHFFVSHSFFLSHDILNPTSLSLVLRLDLSEVPHMTCMRDGKLAE